MRVMIRVAAGGTCLQSCYCSLIISSHHSEPEGGQTHTPPQPPPQHHLSKALVPCSPPLHHLTQHSHCQTDPTPAAPLTQTHLVPALERVQSEASTERSITPACLPACPPQETPFRPGD